MDRFKDWLGMMDLIRDGFEQARMRLEKHGVQLELYMKEFPTYVRGPWWDATSEKGFGQLVFREDGVHELRMIHINAEPEVMITYEIGSNESGLHTAIELLRNYLGCR
jgi:hypothetical protein